MRFADLLFRLQGSTSGETIVRSAAAASGTITLPGGTTDFSATGGTSQVVRQSAAGGAFTVSQLAAADVTGALTGNQTITLSGDIAGSGTTAITTTLPNVNANLGTFQGITVNAKGLITAAANQSYAPLASPVFTGTPSLPTGTTGITQTAGNSTTALATTAFVATSYAPLASPTFTGTPAAPTAAAATNTTQIATTAYVKSNVPVPMTVPLGGTGATSLPLTAGPPAIGLTGSLLQTNGTVVGPATDATGTVAWWSGGFLACAGAGGQGSLSLIRVNGSLATPTGVLSGQIAGQIYCYGWTSAPGLSQSAGSLAFTATENWTGTAQGTRFDVYATPNGSATPAIKMSVQNGLVVGAPTGGDKGLGTLNATGLYINNVPAAPLASPSFTGNATIAGSLTVAGHANPTLGDYAGYTTIWAADGSAGVGGINIGPSSAANNYYRNTQHLFVSRDGTVNFAQFNSGGTYNVSGSWQTISDSGAKRDVARYERGLDAILHLEPVSFSYNGQFGTTDDGRTHLGLIADNVADVMPEVVGTSVVEDKELRTLSPGLLTYALINAVKELAARVEALEARLAPVNPS